ncbi:hypothetical protein CPB85DRAFT_1436936 [Mucidula mucida]|nr:hypothetical protein CPB85DRAFT_1436936 [Mucidula mucida]
MPPALPAIPTPKTSERARLLMLVKRKDGISKEEFRKHWTEVHTPMVMRMIGKEKMPLKYQLMHVNEQTTDMLMWMGKETTEWDGVAMVEAHSFKDIFAIFQDERVSIAGAADEERFMDRTQTRLIPLDFTSFLDD